MLGVSANLMLSAAYGGVGHAGRAAARPTAKAVATTTGTSACRCGTGGCGCSTDAAGKSAADGAAKSSAANGRALTPAEQDQVESLKSRDAEVRRHEAAHLAAAGGFARGGPVYNFKAGPDGKRYAVGGHVDVDTSAVAGDPKATLAKARQVQRAALAPADPSGQDHAVAASAAATAAKAQTELSAERAGAASGAGSATASADGAKAIGGSVGERKGTTRAGRAAAAAYATAGGASAPPGGTVDLVG